MYYIDNNITKQINGLLMWTEDEYMQFVEQCGIKYLQTVVDTEAEYVLQFIRRSETYWNWWKFHWEQRDKEFIEQCYNWDEGVHSRVAFYQQHHNPAVLAAALYLNGQVLQESYASMIEELHKNVHRSPIVA